MRRKLYFVIYPKDEDQQKLQDLISSLNKDNPVSKSMPIEWVQEKFKIPLIYLGAVSDEAKAAAIEAASEVFAQGYPFEIKAQYISYFYKEEKKPSSLLFLDITDKEKNIKNIHSALSSALRGKGFSPATHFTPHIPIGRLARQKEDHKQRQMLDELSQIELPDMGSFLIDSVQLVEVQTDDILSPRESLVKTFTLNRENN